jgi:hypothetical protein
MRQYGRGSISYHWVSSGHFREPEALEQRSKDSERSIDGERSIDEYQVNCISGRIITKSMIDKSYRSQEP